MKEGRKNEAGNGCYDEIELVLIAHLRVAGHDPADDRVRYGMIIIRVSSSEKLFS